MDFTEGRIINPGHYIEGVWFILEYAKRMGKSELIEKCEDIFINAFEAGWDKEYGEWYGYLRRDGLPTMPPCKRSTFKGPFHLPRMLSMVDVLIDEIIGE